MNQPLDSGFINLINEHIAIAHRVSRIYFRDEADQDDAVQEMMFQLWKAYPGFEGNSKFSTWMYRVCLNTALTYRRNNKKRVSESLKEEHHQIGTADSKSEEERSKLLYQAIETLSPLNKAIILLYLDDMSYDEIAEVTTLTKSNVSVRLVRIRKELEEYVKTKME